MNRILALIICAAFGSLNAGKYLQVFQVGDSPGENGEHLYVLAPVFNASQGQQPNAFVLGCFFEHDQKGHIGLKAGDQNIVTVMNGHHAKTLGDTLQPTVAGLGDSSARVVGFALVPLIHMQLVASDSQGWLSTTQGENPKWNGVKVYFLTTIPGQAKNLATQMTPAGEGNLPGHRTLFSALSGGGLTFDVPERVTVLGSEALPAIRQPQALVWSWDKLIAPAPMSPKALQRQHSQGPGSPKSPGARSPHSPGAGTPGKCSPRVGSGAPAARAAAVSPKTPVTPQDPRQARPLASASTKCYQCKTLIQDMASGAQLRYCTSPAQNCSVFVCDRDGRQNCPSEACGSTLHKRFIKAGDLAKEGNFWCSGTKFGCPKGK